MSLYSLRRLCSPLLAGIKLDRAAARRHLYEVQHSTKKRIFYVTLDEYNKQAILYYRLVGEIMDLRSTNVPKQFSGRGIARLLTETAFTYAIVNRLKLFLTCTYSQHYYLCNKNAALQERVVGPKHILETSVSLDPDSFDRLPDPQDYIPTDRKN